jgi:hypothetical protein
MRILTKEEAKGIDVDYIYRRGDCIAITNDKENNIVQAWVVCKECKRKVKGDLVQVSSPKAKKSAKKLQAIKDG